MDKPILIVKNFLNIENVELELSKINVIIGKQATGKSILAKLVFFFQSCLLDSLNYAINPVIKDIKEADLIKNNTYRFYQIFPKYTWENQSFTIIYKEGESQTTLKLDENSHELTIEYSDDFREIMNLFMNSLKESRESIIKTIKGLRQKIDAIDALEIDAHLETLSLSVIQIQGSPEEVTKIRKLIEEFRKQIKQNEELVEFRMTKLEEIKVEEVFEEVVKSIMQVKFVTAGRSFFYNLQRNIFSLLRQDIQIDYFSKEFGAEYERIKNDYRNSQEILPEVSQLISQIISGKYIYEGNEDWIESATTKQKIRLVDASSGQQEALPMLLTLASFSAKKETHSFFIEEPEAHLFPTSQKHIIDLIGLLFNQAEKRNSFFITTHSPYILTALDNLIQAGNTLTAINQIESEQIREEMLQKLYAICPANQILHIEDVRAYTIEEGKIRSIINEENQLIDQNIVDEVSQDIGTIFDGLLDLEFAAKEIMGQ